MGFCSGRALCRRTGVAQAASRLRICRRRSFLPQALSRCHPRAPCSRRSARFQSVRIRSCGKRSRRSSRPRTHAFIDGALSGVFRAWRQESFGRGSNEEKLAAIEDYCKNPNPDALIVFVADHISIPADVRRMEMQDKERYQRIRETMGSYCGIVELARVEEGEAVRWIAEYCASREVPVKIDPMAPANWSTLWAAT